MERGFLQAWHIINKLVLTQTGAALLPSTLISPSHNMKYKSATALLIAAAAPAVIAGPLGYAICQTGNVHERNLAPLSQPFE
jgi:hypothetical protein